MKKFFRNAAILSLGFGLAMTFTACHHSSDGEPAPAAQTIINEYKTLVVTSNVPATFTFGKYKTTAATTSWSISAADFAEGTRLVVTPKDATTYTAQGVTVYFGDEDYREFNFTLNTKSTTSKTSADADAEGKMTVTNDSQNQNASGVTAEMDIDINNILTAGVNDVFSVIVYTPAGNGSVLAEGTTITEPVYSIACTPDGIVFKDPIDVRLNIKGANRLDVQVANSENASEVLNEKNKGLERNPNDILVKIPHFSEWNVNMAAKIVSIETTYVPFGEPIVMNVSAKRTNVKYTRRSGYETDDQTVLELPLVKKFLDQSFNGPVHTVTSTYGFTPSTAGVATINFEQAVRYVTLQSDQTIFHATVYGAVRGKVAVEPTPTPSHSGGSSVIQ